MVNVDDSSLLADSRPKSVGFVLKLLRVGSHLALFYINQMNWVNFYNDFVSLSLSATLDHLWLVAPSTSTDPLQQSRHQVR